MDTRRLSYFLQAAQDGSLTRAAGLLRVAQPALSRQIRLLEEDLGVKLFARTARGMRLTEAGEALRASTAGPIRELELAIGAMRAASRERQHSLAVGLPPGLASILAVKLALQVRQDFPDIGIRMVEGPTGSLGDWLGRGVIDLALLEESPRDERIRDEPLAVLPMVLIGPQGSPGTGPMRFADVAALPLIIPSHHLGIRGAIDDAVAATATRLDIRFQADAPRLILDMVASGAGHALLPEAYCTADVDAGRIEQRVIVAPGVSITLSLASRRNADRPEGSQIGRLAAMIAEIVGAAFPAEASRKA